MNYTVTFAVNYNGITITPDNAHISEELSAVIDLTEDEIVDYTSMVFSPFADELELNEESHICQIVKDRLPNAETVTFEYDYHSS